MSKPVKHHFVPEFYLSKWANDEKLVPVWHYSSNGKIQNAPRSPGAICYHPRLYELKLDFRDESGFDTNFETEFYTPLDTISSKAFARTIDTGFVANSDRGIISQFIGGLIGRSKFRIETIKSTFRPMFESAIDDLDPDMRSLTRAKFSDTPADDMAAYISIAMGPEFAELAPDYLVKKTWQILHTDGLLTSDNPVTIEPGPDSTFGICLPLSPKHLLIVHDNRLLSSSEYNKRQTRNLANIAILKQAHTRVIGRAERSFIQKHWKP